MRAMVNRHRGEVSAVIDGTPRVLCLTLGALAELEHALELDNLSQLGDRLAKGLSAGDILAVVTAGLRGAGETVTPDEVAQMRCDGGATGFARLAADLMTATFPDISP